MHHVELFALVAGAVLVTGACRRRGWPAPLVVTGVALVVSFLPFVPRYEIDSDALLGLVLPPLLYSAALSSSYRDFRASLNAITRLGVGLVLVTALVVAGVVWWLEPSASFAVALVLGAVVAPPDAVAATAVGRRLGLPRRVMTVLGGESLVNDGTSLTLYKVALAGVTGAWALGEGLATFGLAVVVGVVVGLVLGWLVHRLRLRLDDAVFASAVGLLTPFAAYWGAEQVHGSGVLAVVAAGLYLGHTSPRAGFATRLYEEPIWSTLDLLLEAFTFALIGVQLPWVVRDVVASHEGLPHAIGLSLAVLLACLLVRPAYVFGTTWFDDLRLRGSHRTRADRLSGRERAVVSWAGMRGVVTLAAAAAIPATADGAPFPGRATLQLAAYTVALGTLAIQGLTLPAVITRLRVGAAQEAADDAVQEAAMRLETADAVQHVLEAQHDDWVRLLGRERAEATIARVSQTWRARAAAAAFVLDPDSTAEAARERATAVRQRLGGAGRSPAAPHPADVTRRVHELRRTIVAAQREVLMEHRDAGDLDETVMRRMLRELDLEEESLASSWVERAPS